MTGDSHVIGVEGFACLNILVYIAVAGGLNHLPVGAGPGVDPEVKSAAFLALIVVAVGGKVLVPLVVGVLAVVPGGSGVAYGAEHIAQGGGHGVADGGDSGVRAAFDPVGYDAGGDGELAAAGGERPVWLVEIGEDEALLLGEAVEGGRQLLVDYVVVEGLSA